MPEKTTTFHNGIPPGPWTLEQAATWPFAYTIRGADGQPVLRYQLDACMEEDTRETANARPANAKVHAIVRMLAHAWRLAELAAWNTAMAASIAELVALLENVPCELSPTAARSIALARARAERAKAATL